MQEEALAEGCFLLNFYNSEKCKTALIYIKEEIGKQSLTYS